MWFISNRLKTWNVSAGNYAETRTDGTKRLHWEATAWRDMVSDLFSKRLNSNTWKVDYDRDNNAVKFQSWWLISNVVDRVQGNQQINHEFKVWTWITFKPHIHWFQEISGGAITHAFVLTMRYRLQRNWQAKVSARTTVTLTAGTDDVFDFTSEADGTYNQLSKFPDITIDCSVSDTIQFQMARTDSLWDDMLIYFSDIHWEVDSFWSDTEFGKV